MYRDLIKRCHKIYYISISLKKIRLQTNVPYQRYLFNEIAVGKIKLLLNNIYFKSDC